MWIQSPLDRQPVVLSAPLFPRLVAEVTQVTDISFSALPLADGQLANLESLGYLEMTPVQAATLPLAFEGRDLIAQAKTGSGKTALEDHFDRSWELEHTLKERGKDDLLQEIKSLVPETGSIVYTRQNQPLGLGHAIWCARDIVGDEPFAVLLADDLIRLIFTEGLYRVVPRWGSQFTGGSLL